MPACKLKHYSSGMASRLAYAVAFRAVREVLVLDEIFAVGDAGFRARCEAAIASCMPPATRSLLVSHDPRVIETLLHTGHPDGAGPHRRRGLRSGDRPTIHDDHDG